MNEFEMPIVNFFVGAWVGATVGAAQAASMDVTAIRIVTIETSFFVDIYLFSFLKFGLIWLNKKMVTDWVRLLLLNG
jgi:hypothetical protein